MMWEIDRAGEPSLRWACATCHCLSVEHHRPWFACADRWVDQGREAKVRHEHRLAYIIGALFGGAH